MSETIDMKFASCDCTIEEEHWMLIESPLEGDDELGFYQCENCDEMVCFDGRGY